MFMADESLQINGVALSLVRPGKSEARLRAWDAADELLLEQALAILAASEAGPEPRVLVVDDQFGALTLGLSRYSPVTLADSATLAVALRLNANGAMPFVEPASWFDPPGPGFDLVVMRIPRQIDYLSWLLGWVNQVLDPTGLILAGGMIKHLPDRSAQLFDERVATQAVSRAWRKARVITAKPGKTTGPAGDGRAEQQGQWQGYGLPGTDLQVEALPAVFSRRKLDIGTRKLLPFVRQYAGELPPGSRVLDLACGNGVLGLAALAQNPALDLTFSDVSSQALLSARHNVKRGASEAVAAFSHCDGLAQGLTGYRLILLNPPFHEGGAVGDHIALALFDQAAAALAPGGRLLMVGNRHLGYHRALKRSFSRVRQLAASPKFVVFEAGPYEAGRS